MVLPNAVFFDLDDTILSGETATDESWKHLCEEHAAKAGLPDAEKFFRELLAQRAWYWGDLERHRLGRLNLPVARAEIIEMALANLGFSDREAAASMARAYGELMAEKIIPFPNAIATLSWFKKKGVRLALLTNGSSEQQRRKIRRFELEPFFDLILIEGEFGAGKPELSVFRHALKAFEIEPSEAWMVGDKLEFDIVGAKALGIFTVWNDFAKTGLPANAVAQPDRIVHSIHELVQP